MSKSNFSEDFKRDAVRQITERVYPIVELSQRLGVSQHSLYKWEKKFAALNAKGDDEAEKIGRLKKELARVTEERDILKKTITGFGLPVRSRNRPRYDRCRRPRQPSLPCRHPSTFGGVHNLTRPFHAIAHTDFGRPAGLALTVG